MSTQAERATAISHASEALGDPGDFFETHSVSGKPAQAPGILGAFGRTVDAEKEEKTSQVFARDLIAVANFIVTETSASESPVGLGSTGEAVDNVVDRDEEDTADLGIDGLSAKREAVREVLRDMTRDTDFHLEVHIPETGSESHDWVKGFLDLDRIIVALNQSNQS